MAIETINVCPLGSECESIKDGKLHKCMWHVGIEGQHPQTGEMVKEMGCAIAYNAILLLENSRQQRDTAAAIESFRNETMVANQMTRDFLLTATNTPNPMLEINPIKE